MWMAALATRPDVLVKLQAWCFVGIAGHLGDCDMGLDENMVPDEHPQLSG